MLPSYLISHVHLLSWMVNFYYSILIEFMCNIFPLSLIHMKICFCVSVFLSADNHGWKFVSDFNIWSIAHENIISWGIFYLSCLWYCRYGISSSNFWKINFLNQKHLSRNSISNLCELDLPGVNYIKVKKNNDFDKSSILVINRIWRFPLVSRDLFRIGYK